TEKISGDGIPAGAEVFILLFFIVSSIFHIFLFQFLNSEMELRYFIPFLVLYIPVLAVLFNRITKKLSSINSMIFIAVITMMLTVQGALKFQEILRADNNSSRNEYITYLETHRLNYGFATFWNANVTAELSNGRIEIAGLAPDTIHVIHNWLAPSAYENPDYHKGETFLLLTKDEWETYSGESILQRPPDYRDDHFVVFRFPSTGIIFDELIQNNH
ncbi:MAG: hypothetical protein LBQ61_10200, partial [Spirochaetales bacterium]|nr:hypothetical protein [Spirochaetales bacterium]